MFQLSFLTTRVTNDCNYMYHSKILEKQVTVGTLRNYQYSHGFCLDYFMRKKHDKKTP